MTRSKGEGRQGRRGNAVQRWDTGVGGWGVRDTTSVISVSSLEVLCLFFIWDICFLFLSRHSSHEVHPKAPRRAL